MTISFTKIAAKVSIRSPHKSKGRPYAHPSYLPHDRFQSAPLTKARGDPRNPSYLRSHFGFNPLPSQKQGETEELEKEDKTIVVSIRSPHKSKGRLGQSRKRRLYLLFQSAPLTKARGDLYGRLYHVDITHVSIRSPHKSKGRHKRFSNAYLSYEFQSAPLTKARGDTTAAKVNNLKTGVSIRSPHKSKGRHRSSILDYESTNRFNPLPSQKQGETREPIDRVRQIRRFNPLPSQKQGETAGTGRLGQDYEVSIRSPHKSKGRHIGSRAKARHSAFQSAPLTKARGDTFVR